MKNPATEEERKECLLAKRLCNTKKYMTQEDLHRLDELKAEAQKKRKSEKDKGTAEELMDKVRALGHYPSDKENSVLARALRKARAAALFSLLKRLSLTSCGGLHNA